MAKKKGKGRGKGRSRAQARAQYDELDKYPVMPPHAFARIVRDKRTLNIIYQIIRCIFFCLTKGFAFAATSLIK